MKYLPIFLGILLLTCTASAVTWTDNGGCWTATDGASTIVKWNATGTSTWTPPDGVTSLWIVVVGGGGSGGGNHVSGGGGAGGFINNTSYSVSTTPYTIVVGAGGAPIDNAHGNQGSNSSFGLAIAMGGGWGGDYGAAGSNGGSGGGGGGNGGAAGGATNQPTTGISAGIGYSGGTSQINNRAGGGGGASQAGQYNTSSGYGGNGGDGVSNSITGETVIYAAGGGGSGLNTGLGGIGGSSNIGGNGGTSAAAAKPDGTNETGSGGGGGYYTGSAQKAGGRGGTGVVIVRYTTPSVGGPLVSFTSNVTSGYAPLDVQFNDTSVTSPTAWNWSFTNVTPGNNTQVWWSTIQNATKTFGAGNWNIKMNVTNASGYNVSTANYWVNVSATLLTANFTANKTTVLPSETILFTDSTTGSGITSWNWSWDFGDGTTATTQNPTKSYSSVGTYSVNLTVYNSTSGFSSLNRTSYILVTDSGGLSGFNQQDIMMDEIYSLHLTFKDASTLADIPVVTVTDNYNDTTVTTVGTAFLQYNYSTVVIYAVSTGYYGRSQSYLINRDRVETFYLTPETATANVSSQTVTYYSPWQVRIRILDSYGVPLENATVTANYVASTLPSTNTSWLVSAYGVEPITAGEMVNSSIAMAGVTDSNGGLSFTMFKSIQYTLAITNTTAGVSATKTLYPTDQEYIIRVATSSQIAGTNTLEAMQNTSLPVYVLNATAYNLSAIYHDTTGRTSNVMFYVKWRNGTIIHQYDMGNPGTSAVSYNYTIINPGIGTEVIWMYNATRSGL